jgi:hypothetical protein
MGMESQFRTLLYDEMDYVQGPFLNILTMMALLLLTNQKGHADPEVNVELSNEKGRDIEIIHKEYIGARKR